MKNTDQNIECEIDSEKSKTHLSEQFIDLDEKHTSCTDALKVLRSSWPKVFNVSEPKPLKVGIHKDIAESSNIPKWLIAKALEFFTTRDEYLQTIKKGAIRIDLNGVTAGNVKLKEAVDAETKRYYQSSSYKPQRRTFLVKKSKLLAVNYHETVDNLKTE